MSTVLPKGTISLTFGDQGENHAGMQIIGKPAERGFGLEELTTAADFFTERGLNCEILPIHEKLPVEIYGSLPAGVLDAYLLVVKNGVSAFVSPDDLYLEQLGLGLIDKKALMRGRVVNKVARWNLCYDDMGQTADYEHGKGTIVSFSSVPLISLVREELAALFGIPPPIAELNYYYDVAKCGIGYHGDTERKILMCCRLGESMTLSYQWHIGKERVGEQLRLKLDHGDLYVMSEKAVGYDWKKSVFTLSDGTRVPLPTLRHAAGCRKYVD